MIKKKFDNKIYLIYFNNFHKLKNLKNLIFILISFLILV